MQEPLMPYFNFPPYVFAVELWFSRWIKPWNRGMGALRVTLFSLFQSQSSRTLLVVNKYIKINPCCSPCCRNIVSSEEQRDYFFSSSFSVGNDEQPQLVVLHLLHIPSWKIPTQHTELCQHEKHLLRVTGGKAEGVVGALGSWSMSVDKLPVEQRGDQSLALLHVNISVLF